MKKVTIRVVILLIFTLICYGCDKDITNKELNFDPGEDFLYSNTGFTLLAEVVARVSGQSFTRFTKLNIFNPLGMTNTIFYDDHEKIVQNRAYSYYRGPLSYKKSVLKLCQCWSNLSIYYNRRNGSVG